MEVKGSLKFCEKCSSSEMEFVKYVFRNGTTNIRQQCNSCGKLHLDNFKHSYFNLKELRFKDDDKLNEHKEYRLKSYLKNNEIYENKSNILSEGYKETYLRSPEWRYKRDLIIKRDKNKCRCCDEKARDVHHITYKRLGNEWSQDLISVCRSCHEKIHSKDYVYVNLLKPYSRATFGILDVCEHKTLFDSKDHRNSNRRSNIECEKCIKLSINDHEQWLITLNKRLDFIIKNRK